MNGVCHSQYELYFCLVSQGPIHTSRQNRNCLWNIYTKILYDDNFCFEKYYPHWKLLTLIRPLHLTTPVFVNGKNNGFTTNDWQEKHISVYLVKFVCTSCVGQNFKNRNKPSVFVKCCWWQKIVKINSFFASVDRPLFFFIKADISLKNRTSKEQWQIWWFGQMVTSAKIVC